MGYRDAIEQQVATLQRFTQPDAKNYFARLFDTPSFRGRSPEEIERWSAGFLASLIAEVYTVAGPIIPLIAEAAASLRALTATRDLLPTPFGFLALEQPLDNPWGDAAAGDSAQLPVGGFSWASIVHEDADHALTDLHGILVLPLVRSAARSFLAPTGNAVLYFGDAVAPEVFAEPQYTTLRWLLAAWLFMRQHILTTSTRPVLSRQARKRLARELGHEPFVRVVELRARDYQRHDEAATVPVDWSCQWLVRGHWHTYHTKDGTVPIFVQPYMKGPPDKPLRVPENVAYEVVR